MALEISPEILKAWKEKNGQKVVDDFRTKVGAPGPAPAPLPVIRAPYEIPAPAPVTPLRTPVTAESMGERAVRDSQWRNYTETGSIYHPDAAPRPSKEEPPKGDTPAPTTPAPTRTAPSTGRNDSAPDGSEAKGTNTGFKGFEIDLGAANSLLGGFGVQLADANSFLSEQLPVSASSKPVQPQESLMDDGEFILSAQGGGFLDGYKGDPGTDAAREYARAKGFNDTKVVEGVSVAGQKEKPFASAVETADNNRAISVPGEKPAQTKRGPIRGAVDSRFDDGAEYGESYAVEKTPGRAMFSSTFLSGDGDSMAALRRAEASVGKFVQGGQVFANDGGTLREITKEAGDKMNTGTLSAQEFKDSFKENVKQTLVPVDTPDVTSNQTAGSNKNYDSDGFSVDDATVMGYSQEDAEAIGSGGQVETVFSPNPGTDSEFTQNNNPPTGDDTYFGGKAQAIRNMRDKYFDK